MTQSYDTTDRLIFHVDVNSAFLSWEAVDRLCNGETLDLRTVPSCVGGDPDCRTSIVSTKSIPAKKYELVKGDHHNMLIPVHGVGELVKAESSQIEEAYRGDLKASGYLVVLDNVSVRPAKQEEVKFG